MSECHNNLRTNPKSTKVAPKYRQHNLLYYAIFHPRVTISPWYTDILYIIVFLSYRYSLSDRKFFLMPISYIIYYIISECQRFNVWFPLLIFFQLSFIKTRFWKGVYWTSNVHVIIFEQPNIIACNLLGTRVEI